MMTPPKVERGYWSRLVQPLRNRNDIHRVFQEGVRAYAAWAVLHARPRGDHEPPRDIRVGVIASKRVGGAVARNRARRLLRETTFLLLRSLSTPWDILLVARPEVLHTSFSERVRGLGELFAKVGLVKETSCL